MIYFVISVVGFVIIVLQNLGNTNSMCIGNQSCNVGNTFLALVVMLYIYYFGHGY